MCWRKGLAGSQPDCMARLQTQAILPRWRMATRKPAKGKKLTGFVLKQQMEECVDTTTKFRSCSFFFLPNSYFPAFMGRMLQAQGNAAVTPPFLSPNFCFRKCIMKLMKTRDLLELIHTSGGGRRESSGFFFHRRLTLANIKETRENRDPPHPPTNTFISQHRWKSTGHSTDRQGIS